MKSYTPLLAFLLTLFVVSCGGSDDTQQLTFAKASVSRQVKLTADADAPQCQINIAVDYANTGNAATDKTINNTIERELFGMENISMKAAIDSFAQQYVADYSESLLPLYRADRADKEKHKWYEYSYNVKTETAEGLKGYTVFRASTEYYEGGAHSVSLQTVLNFDNKTGRLVTLADVFVKGSDKRLAEILLEALEDKTGKKGIDALKADGYLCTTDMYAPQNFVLGSDGITFVFNAYEIAPYEKGLIELTVDYDTVDDLLVEKLR